MAFNEAMKMMGKRGAKPAESKQESHSDESEGELGSESEHIGHKLMTMAHEHEPEGTHMHIHHDGFTATTHHVGPDGEVQGPHEHASDEDLHHHISSVIGGEEQAPQEAQPQPEEQSLGGYGG